MASLDHLRADWSKFKLDPESSLEKAKSVGTSEKHIQKALGKKELVRFYYIDSADMWINNYRAREGYWKQFYVVLEKVITVASAILTILFPLAIYYLPAWAPWGIGLPLMFALGYAKDKFKGKIEVYKREEEFVPHLKELLKRFTPQALHPRGEWDLEKIDERLKSDVMMETELEKRHPASGKEIKDTLVHYDLDISPYAQHSIAHEFAHIESQDWRSLQDQVRKWRALYRKAPMEEGLEEEAELLHAAFAEGYGPGLHRELDFWPETQRSSVEGLVAKYARVYHLAAENVRPEKKTCIKAFVEEFKGLYEPYKFFESEVKGELQGWEKYLERVAAAKKKVDQLTEYSADLEQELLKLFDDGLQMKAKLVELIANHPLRRLEALGKQMHEIQEKKKLNYEGLKALKAWIKKVPESSDKRCIDFFDGDFPEETKKWLLSFPKLRFEKPAVVLEQARKTRSKINEASKEFVTLQKASSEIAVTKENYENFVQALDTFENEVAGPLHEFLALDGESLLTKCLKAFYMRLPSVPFVKEKLPDDDPILRSRKIAEIQIDMLLRQMDGDMLTTNRVRNYALRIPLALLLVVEAVAFFYLSSHWWFVGFSALSLAGEALSYYIDYRLQQMDKEKQAFKLQHHLEAHPNIGPFPGTRPQIETLKEVQNKYDLDGIRPTWARTLSVGESALMIPQDLNSAKDFIQKLAETGSSQAAEYLKNQRVMTFAYWASLKEPPNELRKKLKAKVNGIDAALDYVPEPKEYKAKTVTDYEKLTLKRNAIDKKLDAVVEEMQGLNIKINEYSKIHKLYTNVEDLPKREQYSALKLQEDPRYKTIEQVEQTGIAMIARRAVLDIERKRLISDFKKLG